MTNDFFNHYLFVRTFQWTSSECLTNVTIMVKVAKLHICKVNARNNIFKYIKKKHGHDLIKVVRDFKQKKTKFEKLVADIAFITLCKKPQLIPTFAKVNVSIRNGTYKLKRKIARLVMETELQNKHREKCKLRKDIGGINVLLSTSLSVIVYNALLHYRV